MIHFDQIYHSACSFCFADVVYHCNYHILSDEYEWLINTCHIAGIPEGMTDIEAIKMHLQNSSAHLTANDCESLFNTIKEASPVIGGKIWTENNIDRESVV